MQVRPLMDHTLTVDHERSDRHSSRQIRGLAERSFFRDPIFVTLKMSRNAMGDDDDALMNHQTTTTTIDGASVPNPPTIQSPDMTMDGSTSTSHEPPKTGEMKKSSSRGRKRKDPQTVEERREKEREKKARWRAKKREKDTLSHHLRLSHRDMPREIWQAIQHHLQIYSTGSPEDEAQSFVTLLNTVGYAWQGTALIRAPGKLLLQPSLLQVRQSHSSPMERDTSSANHVHDPNHSPQSSRVKQRQKQNTTTAVIMSVPPRTMDHGRNINNNHHALDDG